MSTSKSEILFEKSKSLVPGGVHSPVRAFKGVGGTPVFIESASGSRFKDVEGKEYLDFCLSWGPLILGHKDEEITEAAHQAIESGWSYGTAERYSLELAEFIASRIPWAEKIRFVNSGTEAVMSALRVARAATGRDKILKFEGCYHGHTDSMLVKAGSGLAEMASPDSAGITPSTASDTLVVPLDADTELEEVFRLHGTKIAAVILEPIPANNGLLPQREEFIKKIFALSRKNQSLVIFDEVITGFRVSFGGMAERLGLQPDLVTYGKIIGGGFPVGAFAGKKELMDWVAPVGPVYQAGTLSANPIAMRVGLATLKKLSKLSPYRDLEQKNLQAQKQIHALFSKKGIEDARLVAESSMFWLVFGKAENAIRKVDQIPQSQREIFPKFFHSMLKRGIYLAPSGYEVGFLSTAHTTHDLEQFMTAFEESIDETAITHS